MRFGFMGHLPCADWQSAVLGDPEHCAERVQALQREFQTNEFICYFNQGDWLSMLR